MAMNLGGKRYDEGTDTMENRLESLPKFEFKDIENTRNTVRACYEVRRAWAVPHMSSDEMYALYEIASGLHDDVDGYVVEIGTYQGGSAAIIAAGLKVLNRPNQFVTIDNYSWHISGLMVSFESLKEQGFSDYVLQVVGDSLHYLSNFWNFPIRLAHIDDGHRYDSVKTQINLILPYLVVGGWITFHDYFPLYSRTEVYKAVNEFLDINPSNFMAYSIENMICVQKIK